MQRECRRVEKIGRRADHLPVARLLHHLRVIRSDASEAGEGREARVPEGRALCEHAHQELDVAALEPGNPIRRETLLRSRSLHAATMVLRVPRVNESVPPSEKWSFASRTSVSAVARLRGGAR